ncbi:MAG: hypothetical protein P4L92_12800 [Rudaea sp.]|nr:hypothetical protein [Rudaea sp.]
MRVQSDETTLCRPAEDLWLSLEELKQAALAHACTPAQFGFAVEVAGAHPVRVARYLKLHSFIPPTFAIPGDQVPTPVTRSP